MELVILGVGHYQTWFAKGVVGIKLLAIVTGK